MAVLFIYCGLVLNQTLSFMPDFKYDKVIHKGPDHESVAEMVCQWANDTLTEEKMEINIVATDIVTAPDPEKKGGTIYVAITIFQYRYFY